MKRGKIIVIEGASNSGKTTACQNMKKYENCEIIDECMVYEPNPPRPSKCLEDEINNQIFFFKVEKRRLRKATKLALEGKNVILDRCALSTVAIAYAFEKMEKYKTFKHAINEYENLIKDETLIKPDEYIFLYTDTYNTEKRNETRLKKLSKEWIDKRFTDYQNEFYFIIEKKIDKSKLISTTGKDKEYISTRIANILGVKEKEQEKEK